MVHTGQAVQAELEKINSVLLLRLSDEISSALSSRSMVMTEGFINGLPFVAPAEPNGLGGHFIIISAEQAVKMALSPGNTVDLSLGPAKIWPDPDLPADFLAALTLSGLIGRWQACTVRGRWEWLRWLRATNSKVTRQKRISVACDKLRKGAKRPCCFNTAACTVMKVCKTGVLVET